LKEISSYFRINHHYKRFMLSNIAKYNWLAEWCNLNNSSTPTQL